MWLCWVVCVGYVCLIWIEETDECGGERERKVKSEGCAERNKNSSSVEKFIGDLEMVAVKESNGSNSL